MGRRGGVEGMGSGGMGRNTKVWGDWVCVCVRAKIRPKACRVPELQEVEHKVPWVRGRPWEAWNR